ncbi:hypothetical protein UUA_13005 [Rhodanobacter thiooxydans LCS2]|nr:hypothetical protein UUA_13005 [Rhodanobacter thiooxydans LCS2]
MRRLAGLALDMGIRLETTGKTDVALESRPELAEVVPSPSDARPFQAKMHCKASSEIADTFQVIDQIMRRSPVASSIVGGMSYRVRLVHDATLHFANLKSCDGFIRV